MSEKTYALFVVLFLMYALFVVLLLSSGCAGATGNIAASDPTERGLSYVAAAIVTSAVLRALFNK